LPASVKSRGDIGKPFSAASMAGSKSVAQASLPCLACATSSRRGVPGTPTERPPTTAAWKGMDFPSAPMKSCGRAPEGAVSRPS
jgi:hypothetical protein